MNIVNLMISLLLGLSGVALKFSKAYWLISGYGPSEKEEETKNYRDEMCRSVGNFMFLLSFIVFVMVMGENFHWSDPKTVDIIGWGTFALAVILGIYLGHIKNIRYKTSHTNDK